MQKFRKEYGGSSNEFTVSDYEKIREILFEVSK